MPIRSCLFDLGNVLVFFSHDRMVENVAAASGADVVEVRQLLIHDRLNHRLEVGEVTEQEFHREFEERTGREIPAAQLLTALADIFELNEPMVPLLDELRSLGVRLVLLSNTSKTHIEFVARQWSVLERFDAITASWAVRALKPDPRIFHSALANANCAPGECFYTDDIEDYIAQAAKMGIQAHLFRNAAATRAVLREAGIPVSV